jgi:GGDEF domain-containing protein
VDIVLPGNMVAHARWLQEQGFDAHFERKGQVNPNKSVATGDHIHVSLRPARTRGMSAALGMTPQQTPVKQQPAVLPPTVAAPKPVAAKAATFHPTEKMFLSAQERWKKTPGNAPQAYEDRNVALAETQRAFRAAEKVLLKQGDIVQALEEKADFGRGSPQAVARFEKAAKAYEAQWPAHQAWAKRIAGYGQVPRQTLLFDPLHYRIEPSERRTTIQETFIGPQFTKKQTPGTLREFGGHVMEKARGVVGRVHRELPGALEEWLPGETGRELTDQTRMERINLQRAGVYRRLPQLSGDPAHRQQQIAAKNRMLELLPRVIGNIEVGSRVYGADIYRKGPAVLRDTMAEFLGRPLSPWEKMLFHPLVRNYFVETEFSNRVSTAYSIDAITEIASDLMAAWGAGAAGKLAKKFLAKSLVKPTGSLLSREGLEYLAKRGVIETGVQAVGGATAGGPTEGAISGYYGYQRGERGAKLRQTVATATREGAAMGAAIGGGMSVLGPLGHKAREQLNRRFDPVLRRWVSDPKGQLGALQEARGYRASQAQGRRAAAKVSASRPAPKAPAVKMAHPGPQVRTPDGQLVNLREMDAQSVRAIAETARASGDTMTATRAEEWATRQEAFDDARMWELPKKNIPNYNQAWHNVNDPLRRHHDVLDKASKDENLPSGVRRALADAAIDANQIFIDGFRGALDDPFPRVGPPGVSVWRRLTPEQRRSLSPNAQKSLLALDAINSQRVLDPDQTWPANLKGKSPKQWEQQADTLYQKAQSALEKEFGPLPEPDTQLGADLAPDVAAGLPPEGPVGETIPAQPEATGLPAAEEPAGAAAMAPRIAPEAEAIAPGVAPIQPPSVRAEVKPQGKLEGLPWEGKPEIAAEAATRTYDEWDSAAEAVLKQFPWGNETYAEYLGGLPENVRQEHGRLLDLRNERSRQDDEAQIQQFLERARPKSLDGFVPSRIVETAVRDLYREATYTVADRGTKGAGKLIEELYNRLSNAAYYKEQKLPADFVGDLDLARKTVREFPNSRNGMDLRQLLGQVKSIAEDILGTADKALPAAPTPGSEVIPLEKTAAARAAYASAKRERRQDTAARKRVADMTTEERAAALFADEKTGLKNERAYVEAEKADHQVAIDADSLKWINDNLGHPAGDQLLRNIGDALNAAGLDGFHVSGDEFIVQGNDLPALKKAMAFAEDFMANATVTIKQDDGTKTYKGLSLSYAIKPKNEQIGYPGDKDYQPAYADADAALNAAVKPGREKAGLRAPRGERPPGLAEVGEGTGRAEERDRGADRPAAARRDRAPEKEARAEVAPKPATETPAPAAKPKAEGAISVVGTRLRRAVEQAQATLQRAEAAVDAARAAPNAEDAFTLLYRADDEMPPVRADIDQLPDAEAKAEVLRAGEKLLELRRRGVEDVRRLLAAEEETAVVSRDIQGRIEQQRNVEAYKASKKAEREAEKRKAAEEEEKAEVSRRAVLEALPPRAKPKAEGAKPHPTPDVKPTPSRLKPGYRLKSGNKGSVWEVAGPVEEKYGYKRVDMRLVSTLTEAERRSPSGYRLYAPEYANVGDIKSFTVNEIAREMKFDPTAAGGAPAKAVRQPAKAAAAKREVPEKGRKGGEAEAPQLTEDERTLLAFTGSAQPRPPWVSPAKSVTETMKIRPEKPGETAKQTFLREAATGESTLVRENIERAAKARTGTPIEVTGFRQEQLRARVPNTGVFYALDPDHAAHYSYTRGLNDPRISPWSGPWGGPTKTLTVDRLQSNNPLVIEGGHQELFSILKDLPFTESQKRIIRAAQQTRSYTLIDKAIAQAAKQSGFDSIIYRQVGVIVDLSPVSQFVRPDIPMPAAKKAQVTTDAAAAQARRGKVGEAIPLRVETDDGPKRAMSDTPGAVNGKALKSRVGDCD